MNDATWQGSDDYQFSLRSRVALYAEAIEDGWVWGITEHWSIRAHPESRRRKRFCILGQSATRDEAKVAAEAMAAHVLKRRRSYR